MKRAARGGGWLAAMALLSIGAMVAALVSQHVFAMQPCPWCVLERAIFVAIALVCVIGLLSRHAGGRALAAGLALLLAVAGVASAWWQHFHAAASASCNLTLADKIVSGSLHLDRLWPGAFEARASCADAAVDLLGVPYDFWALGLFVVIAVLAVIALAGLRKMR